MNEKPTLHSDVENRFGQASVGTFTELVRELQAGLRAFTRALGVEADWVDDLAQEVFVIAHQKHAQFESEKDFGRCPASLLLVLLLARLATAHPTEAGECPTPSFAVARTFGAGAGAFSVAVGDFNGDGKPDLAVANSNSNNVSVLLGKGDGTFQTAVNYGAGARAFCVAISDLNGDGKHDLAVANANGVSVMLGKGDGTFQAAVNYNTGGDPRSVAVGDFNGDGKPDLAVGNNGSRNVSVLLGKGDGTFPGGRQLRCGRNALVRSSGRF